MKLGLLSACGVLLLTVAVVYAQEAARPTTRATRPAAMSQPTTTSRPTLQPASAPASQPAEVDEDALVEIGLDDLPTIVALRTVRLLKNVDQFTLTIAYFTNTQEPSTQETAVLAVTPSDKPDSERDGRGGRDDERKRFTAVISRRTASQLIQQLLWDGFLENAENLQRQRPPAPDAGYLLVVTGMGTTDLYEVLPYNTATLERLKTLRKLLDRPDQNAVAAFDKAVEKIANDTKLPE